MSVRLSASGKLLWTDDPPTMSPSLAPKPGSPLRLNRDISTHDAMQLDRLRASVSIVETVQAQMAVSSVTHGRAPFSASDDDDDADDADDDKAISPSWLRGLGASVSRRPSFSAPVTVRPFNEPSVDVYGDKGTSRFIAAYKFEVPRRRDNVDVDRWLACARATLRGVCGSVWCAAGSVCALFDCPVSTSVGR